MTTDGDDYRAEEGSLSEKRCLDLLSKVRGCYDEEEIREEEDDSRVSRELWLFKQKSDGRKNQQKPTYYHDYASSSSSSVVSEEPIRAEPIREVKPIKVRTKRPVKGERGVTPEWLVNLMRTLSGVDAKLVIDKVIQTTDVNANQGRLLIPFNQIVEMDFLNEAELNLIDEHQRDNSKRGVEVIVVASDGRKWKANLRRWNMNCPNYSLCFGWNHVVREINLKDRVGQTLRLWSFHSSQDGKLYLAFFDQPPDIDLELRLGSSVDLNRPLSPVRTGMAPLKAVQETSLESVTETNTTVDLELRLWFK